MRRLPEGTDLLNLTPSGKGLLLHSQRNELFEMLRFRIRAARLPLRHSAPGDMQQLSQACLRKADVRP